MKATIGVIAFAACTTVCAAVCSLGMDGQTNYVQCEGLNDSMIQPIGDSIIGIDIVNSTITTIKAFSFAWAGDTLQELHIIGCGVETLEPNAFSGLVALRNLNLANNRIRKIDASWINGMPKLETLLLWGNRIDEIDPRAYDLLPQLRELDIAYNELDECLTRDNLSKLKNLRKIFIAGNRWRYRCRPSMTWYLGSSHILFIADWGANDRLIEDCLAHEPTAIVDDAVLKRCVDRKVGTDLVNRLDEKVNEMAGKLNRLEAMVEDLKKSKM